MTAFLIELLEANLAAAAAILAVMAARKQVHRLLGPGAAYLLWAVVPAAMLATLVPSRTVLVMTPLGRLSGEGGGAALSTIAALYIDWIALAEIALLLVWIAGAIAMIAFMVKRQRLFLGDVEKGMAGPAVVGFFYPGIVTPSDFAQRFKPDEQKLILAHEQVHLERHDARINALAAMVRCLCWFNPLVHIGARVLRADQELSCDAAVIERRPRARRAYAETLLKTQLADRPLPVGCYWPAGTSHPLAERIAMLTRSPFSDRRRLAAATAVLALVGGGGAAAWAAQPAREVLASASGAVSARLGDPAEIFVPFEPLTPELNDNPVPAPQTKKTYRPTDPGVTSPRMGRNFKLPDYPAESFALHEEGQVTVEVCVAASGLMHVERLVKSSGSARLDTATVKAMEGATFQPGTRVGVPVDTCGYNLTYAWSMPTDAPPIAPP